MLLKLKDVKENMNVKTEIKCTFKKWNVTFRDEKYDIWNENVTDRIKSRLDIAQE